MENAERQVLIEELRRTQEWRDKKESAMAMNYILATLLVVVLVMAFMQSANFARACRQFASKTTDAVKSTFRGLTRFAGFADEACPVRCATAVRAWETLVAQKRSALASAAASALRMTGCAPCLTKSSFEKFADGIRRYESVEAMCQGAQPVDFDDVFARLIEAQNLVDEAITEKFSHFADNVLQGPVTQAAVATTDAAKLIASDAAKAADSASKAPTAVDAVAAVADAASAAKAAALTAAVAPPPAAPATAQLAAAANGSAKQAVVAAKQVVDNPTVAGNTRTYNDPTITGVSQLPYGFPEASAVSNISSYDELGTDQYSSLLVNEVADPKTIANHHEWVREVGKQNTLPLEVMRDGFDESDNYHGLGIYAFNPPRPQAFHLGSPIQQEF